MVILINFFIISCIVIFIIILVKKKFKFFNSEKSIIENLSQIVIILTLCYGIFQYTYYVWPVWEKQNELEKLKKETIELNNTLTKRQELLDKVNTELNIVNEEKDIIEKQNKEKEEIITQKQKEYEIILQNSIIIEKNKQKVEEELYDSYCRFFIDKVFQEYLNKSIREGKTFNFKDEINKYCNSELEQSQNTTIRKKAIQDFIEFANTYMKEKNSFSDMYNFMYSFRNKQ